MNLMADLILTVICVTDEGEFCAISRRLETGCSVEIPEDCLCRFECRCGELVAMPGTDGVEVRFPMEFPYFCEQEEQEMVVREAILEEDSGEEGEKPSIVLRVLQTGESLWEVAKRYGTTMEDIARANELEGRQPGEGTMLLIPRKR